MSKEKECLDSPSRSSSGDLESAEKHELHAMPNTPLSEDQHSLSKNQTSISDRIIRILILPALILSTFYAKHTATIHILFLVLLAVGYATYFMIALVYDAAAAIPLIALTCSVLAIALYEIAAKLYFPQVKVSVKKASSERCLLILTRILVCIGIFAALTFMVWLFVDVILRSPKQLLSLFGFFIIMLVCVWGSKHPTYINWRTVAWGIAMQFVLGALVLRTSVGFNVIKFVGDQIATFMGYSAAGASFVFDVNYTMHRFAFAVLPMIVFFSTFTNMLFYLGLMQWFIGKLSYLTQITLGTSAIESTVAVANIFVGMTEAPLVVRPYLPELTKAEIHSVLTTGLGSIAFSVFGAFVDFKVSSVHLLTACVMSAPASLVVSRMLYPEKEKSKFLDSKSLALTSGTDRNVIEAAAVGASTSIKLVANIAANLIAFLALLAFINSVLAWFGAFVGIEQLSFEVICGYIFMPIAFLLGADWQDCQVVGELFGVKTFLNEFIAYKKMSPYIVNRLNGTISKFGTHGEVLFLSERSEVIAIHALCGFCNISSLGIIIGGLSVLMPKRRSDIANMAVRALIGGMLTCCMTASIAGFLFVENSSMPPSFLNSTSTPALDLNSTIST